VPASESPHRLVNPETLSPPVGFAHAVVAATGRLVFLGGQTSHDAEGICRGDTLVEQFEIALQNVVTALDAAGSRPEHLVSMQIFVTDAAGYRTSVRELGQRYRRLFGRHYPAMALFEVTSLFDPAAQVELMCVAVVPEGA
jgi:enamine deaminase RidA (YjgF/YER057c/UK114 family)